MRPTSPCAGASPDAHRLLWKFVAPTPTRRRSVVRPQARAYIRDVLNELHSEDFYNPTKRFAAANRASQLMAARLKPYGIIVEGVLLGDFAFKPDYQRLINARKEAEKTAEKLEAEILATSEGNQAKLQSKVAELTERLTAAQGEYDQATRQRRRVSRHRQQGAGVLAEKTAQAQGIQKERAPERQRRRRLRQPAAHRGAQEQGHPADPKCPVGNMILGLQPAARAARRHPVPGEAAAAAAAAGSAVAMLNLAGTSTISANVLFAVLQECEQCGAASCSTKPRRAARGRRGGSSRRSGELRGMGGPRPYWKDLEREVMEARCRSTSRRRSSRHRLEIELLRPLAPGRTRRRAPSHPARLVLAG